MVLTSVKEINKLGCTVLFRSLPSDGERPVSTTLMGTGFPSGAPVKWTVNGWIAAVDGDKIAVIERGSDDVNLQSPFIEANRQAGSPVAPVAHGAFQAQLEGSKVATVLTLPFKATPTSGTWAAGDKIYIAADGKWDNTPVGGSSPIYGYLVDYMGQATNATGLKIQFNV